MSTASETRLAHLVEHKETLHKNFKEIREQAAIDVAIDNVNLDGEAIRTPKLHNRWLSELSEAAYMLKKTQNSAKRLQLERWKYYNGKQTDKYYVDYGPVHEKSLKTDLDKYLHADDFLIEMSEILELHEQNVEFLEKTVKDISNRNFLLKSAIDWRKFESGSH